MSDASERAPPPKCVLSKAIGHLAVLCASWRSNVAQGKLSFVSSEGPLTRSRTLHYRTLRFDHLQDRGNRVFNRRIRTALICAVLSCLSPRHFAEGCKPPSIGGSTN